MAKVREVKLEDLRLGGFVGLAGILIRLGKNRGPVTLHLSFDPVTIGKSYLYRAKDDFGISYTDTGKDVHVYDKQGRVVKNPYAFVRLVKDAVSTDVDKLVARGLTIENHEDFMNFIRQD